MSRACIARGAVDSRCFLDCFPAPFGSCRANLIDRLRRTARELDDLPSSGPDGDRPASVLVAAAAELERSFRDPRAGYRTVGEVVYQSDALRDSA